MNPSSNKRVAKERLRSIGLPADRRSGWWSQRISPISSICLSQCIFACILVLIICQSWRPPFPYRLGHYPDRNLVSRIDFQVLDITATEAAKSLKRSQAILYYTNQSQPLDQLRALLQDKLFLAATPLSIDSMSDDERRAFNELAIIDPDTNMFALLEDRFRALRTMLIVDPKFESIDTAVEVALLPAKENGLIQSLAHSSDQGDVRVIRVYPAGRINDARVVEISTVRIAEARLELDFRIKEQFRQKFDVDVAQSVAEMVSHWLSSRLPETLHFDTEFSSRAVDELVGQVGKSMKTFNRGFSVLAPAGFPLGPAQIELLRYEWIALSNQIAWPARIARITACFGMLAALILLIGIYVYSVDDRSLILDRGKLRRLVMLVTTTICTSFLVSRDEWRGEIMPLSIAAIISGMAYGRRLGVLLIAAATLAVTLFIGGGISNLVILSASALSSVLLLGRINSRSRLIYVGLGSGLITFATAIGVSVVTGEVFSATVVNGEAQPLTSSSRLTAIAGILITDAAWSGACVLAATVGLTGFLPVVEKTFKVQTDLSLLELGNASHPLLRRLAQRAPGTYSHSMNVASIAEAAGNEIGANGLLLRVGSYFHDIGKVFKPEYFIENQTCGVNQHDQLQPAMSKLIIVAHVKDGADLAKSNGLPEPIIEFIQQHHGTTLVEYFYREATKRSEGSFNKEEVSDADFRYPGPKPQSLEAAVLMLSDAVESASRCLTEPTPSKIGHLVETIANKKMSDRQFDECGLTFKQLELIKRSLTKSLAAIYHNRLKYPGSQSA
jgi:putative nucleotidyltransferase with HDIG domain